MTTNTTVGSAAPAPVRPDSLPGAQRADFEAVAAELAGVHRLGVAFSGGVDSSLLLAVAAATLGADNVIALLGVSPSLADSERQIAHEVAESIGVKVVEFDPGEENDPAYRANGLDRCFHCKTALFTRIDDEFVAAEGLDAVAYGENVDDRKRPDRPGAKAAHQHRVLAPLAEAGLTKRQIRALARALKLKVANKPAAPCLASRIPHGQEVTPKKLHQIEVAEGVVRAQGFSDCRVRHHGSLARIEVPADELPRILEPEVREAVLEGVRGAGFLHVSFDLAGLQSGLFSMSLLKKEEKEKVAHE